MQGILFIISSPSGGGKGTLIRQVLQSLPNIGYSVSFTTRPMREGEKDGREYNFVTREKFENLIAGGEFLEFAKVHENFYGTSKTQVLKELSAGRDIILEIDVQGAESVRNKMPESVGVFILPPSYEVLKARLSARNTESEADLNLRLENSAGEVRQFSRFDYVIVNEEIEKASIDLKSVILAERCRRARQIERVNSILETFKN